MNNKSIIVSIFSVCFIIPTMVFANSTPIAQQESEIAKPGLSTETPIVVKEKDIKKSEEFIEKYIKDNYADYKIIFILMLDNMSDGHSMQKYTIQKENADTPGETETLDLYFDVEIAMAEFRKKNAAEIRKRLNHLKIIQE